MSAKRTLLAAFALVSTALSVTYATVDAAYSADTAPSPPDHQRNKTLNMDSLRLDTYPVISLVRPVRLEADYDEPISLIEALEYTLQNNIPIKIAHSSLVYQRGQLGGQMALFATFLPNFTSGWNLGYAHVANPATNIETRVYQDIVRYPVFQGGATLYGLLTQYYRERAWKANYKGTISDSLLNVYENYTNLLLNHALLHIRAKAVQVSQTQLQLNNAMYQAGTGTAFAIMQARSQLASDRLALQQQQLATRQASLSLAVSLDLPLSANLVPLDKTVSEQPLVDPRFTIDELMDEALRKRSELRMYEFFRITGNRAVQVAASGLYPTTAFLTAFTRSSESIHPRANAIAAHGLAAAVTAQNASTAGTASNTQLAQTASFTPGAVSSAGTAGANTAPTSVVAASGGDPMANIQSGNLVTSGSVAPALGSLFNTGGGIAPSANIIGGPIPGAGVFPGRFSNFQMGFNETWTLPNIGARSMVAIVSTRALSREALVQANQDLQLVTQELHSDYFSAYVASRQIDVTSYGVDASAEALRIARLRMQSGVGTNLEVLQAQRDYINTLVTKAQAIVLSNQAQAQLLRDTGLISIETLINGYHK